MGNAITLIVGIATLVVAIIILTYVKPKSAPPNLQFMRAFGVGNTNDCIQKCGDIGACEHDCETKFDRPVEPNKGDYEDPEQYQGDLAQYKMLMEDYYKDITMCKQKCPTRDDVGDCRVKCCRDSCAKGDLKCLSKCQYVGAPRR